MRHRTCYIFNKTLMFQVTDRNSIKSYTCPERGLPMREQEVKLCTPTIVLQNSTPAPVLCWSGLYAERCHDVVSNRIIQRRLPLIPGGISACLGESQNDVVFRWVSFLVRKVSDFSKDRLSYFLSILKLYYITYGTQCLLFVLFYLTQTAFHL